MLKEISSDGNMGTVDVAFPASPLLLYLNPNLLKYQILPILQYANNETEVLYPYPFAPHDLGEYPVAYKLPYQQVLFFFLFIYFIYCKYYLLFWIYFILFYLFYFILINLINKIFILLI